MPKARKRTKKEVSTHVFGSFNARKAEGLIAPQHKKACDSSFDSTEAVNLW
jgi:hypothetical protein